MRKPAIARNRARGRVALTKSAPAPVRGWNARDSIAAMHPADAVVLDNWFPSAADVMLRKGSAQHVTGIGGGTAEVETLAVYRPESGSQQMFAFAGTEAYDVSSAGPVGSAVLTTLTNARWQTANITTTGGHFLLCVNGADEMRVFNGTSWQTINGSSSPAITGVSTNELIGVHVHKERTWYIQRNTLDVWYSAAGAFAGSLAKFPLGAVFKKGGYLVAMGTWTIDGGDGADDLAVFVTSEGEVAVYAGTDPASASTWSKVGLYTIGEPIGRRCLAQLGGDLLIITTDGVIPCSKLAIAKENRAVAITDYIQTAMSDAVKLYRSTFGWEATLYPGGSMLLINVPVASGLQEQFVMNTVTGRWARFCPLGANPGWPANCFEVFNGELYFGTQGAVRKAWTGANDVGIAIEGDMLCAFNYFGNRNSQKHFKMVRPIIGWDSNPAQIKLGVDVDFITAQPTSEITLPESSGSTWDDGLWDSGVWGGELKTNREWYGIEGMGYAGALHLTVVSTQAEVRLSAVDYVFEPGGVL